jgi:hypothetical protein
VGLGHVVDPGELMHGRSNGRTATDWGPGDRRGLRELYRDPSCLAVPAPQPPFTTD